MVLKQSDLIDKKENFDLKFTSFTKMNSKWITDLNAKLYNS